MNKCFGNCFGRISDNIGTNFVKETTNQDLSSDLQNDFAAGPCRARSHLDSPSLFLAESRIGGSMLKKTDFVLWPILTKSTLTSML